jgi:hypothetical protein
LIRRKSGPSQRVLSQRGLDHGGFDPELDASARFRCRERFGCFLSLIGFDDFGGRVGSIGGLSRIGDLAASM